MTAAASTVVGTQKSDPMATTGINISHLASQSAAPASDHLKSGPSDHFWARPNAPPRGEHHQQCSWADAAQKHLFDRQIGLCAVIGDNGVKNQGETGREQHSQRAGPGQ